MQKHIQRVLHRASQNNFSPIYKTNLVRFINRIQAVSDNNFSRFSILAIRLPFSQFSFFKRKLSIFNFSFALVSRCCFIARGILELVEKEENTINKRNNLDKLINNLYALNQLDKVEYVSNVLLKEAKKIFIDLSHS